MKKVLKTLPMFVLFMLVMVGLIKVNIVTTKILSPIGNGEENYQMVFNDLGEEFANFIKDEASIKIYQEDSKITMIIIYDKTYILKYPI